MGGEGYWESGGDLNNCGPQREGRVESQML